MSITEDHATTEHADDPRSGPAIAAPELPAVEPSPKKGKAGKKPRAPRYDVYRFNEDAKLGEGIEAKDDREAILQAVEGLPEDQQYGQFLVGLEGQVRLKTREKKVIPETIADDWK